MSASSIKNVVEAVLLAAGKPLTVDQLLSVFGDGEKPDRSQIREAITALQDEYAERCVECLWFYRCPARWSERAQYMVLRWSPSEGATSARRRREQTKAFKNGYRLRSGIEATNSEYKRAYGGGRLRVRGSPAVTRTVKFKFMALNIRRWTKPARKTQNQAA